jgi:Zn-dependent metalloprotease
LVIFVHAGKARLIYAVSFFADVAGEGHPTRPIFIVDAQTGEVLYEYEGLTHAEGTGPSGNQNTGRYHYGLDFDAFTVVKVRNDKCRMPNANGKAVNLRHRTARVLPFVYECFENTFQSINGVFSPINDAYFLGGVIVHMYQDWFGTAPLTFPLVMRVHHGNKYENAFCDGATMNFGDGATIF